MKSIPTLILVALVALSANAAASHTWYEDTPDPICDLTDVPFTIAGTSTQCGDFHQEVCLSGGPSQIVDLVLYCVLNAPTAAAYLQVFAEDVAYATYDLLDGVSMSGYATYRSTWVSTLAMTEGERDTVDGVLCNVVWSEFCALPPGQLLDQPPIGVNDPIRGYPL